MLKYLMMISFLSSAHAATIKTCPADALIKGGSVDSVSGWAVASDAHTSVRVKFNTIILSGKTLACFYLYPSGNSQSQSGVYVYTLPRGNASQCRVNGRTAICP